MTTKKQESVTLEIYNVENMRLNFFKDKAGEFRWHIYELVNDKKLIRYRCDEGYNLIQCKYNAQFFCSRLWDLPKGYDFDDITEDMIEDGY